MVAASRPRRAGDVNYRYLAEELRYLLDNSQAKAIVYHSQFAPTLAEVLPTFRPDDAPKSTMIRQRPPARGALVRGGARECIGHASRVRRVVVA